MINNNSPVIFHYPLTLNRASLPPSFNLIAVSTVQQYITYLLVLQAFCTDIIFNRQDLEKKLFQPINTKTY